MKQIVGKIIWEFAETFHINLGKYAPIIFGWMINSKEQILNQNK